MIRKFMKVQRLVENDVDGRNSLETVRIFFYTLNDPDTNEVRYVGQTVNPSNRYRNHIYEAKKFNRNHKERWIISLIRQNKEPLMNIIWEECMTSEGANDLEADIIKYFRDVLGYKLTNDIDRARNASVVVTNPVYQFTLEGEFIAVYPNANKAMLATGVNDAAIGEMCRFPFKPGNNSRGGFLWSFNPTPEKLYQSPKGTSKRTQQLTKEGVLIAEFVSAREASKATGVCYKRISAAITGRQNTAGGFKWRLAEDEDIV